MLSRHGFWRAQHQARADMLIFVSLLYLLFAGAGKYSIDNYLQRKKARI
ncbi:hypothetical protein [Paraglaciecola mesophila]|nr:hypothetical protein [Paraglaciecola mesophila]